MAELTPPLGRLQPPPFHEMTWQEFQCFCRELLGRDGAPGPCHEYGVNGQMQQGVDLKKEYDSAKKIDVAQCKRWEKIKDPDITETVAAFRPHIPYWKKHRVDRFIIIVSCDVADRKVQAAYQQQRKLLSRQGIRLQLWGARQLEDKLRPHRDIAENYCGAVWAARICRTDAAAIAAASKAAGLHAVVAQIGEVTLELSVARARELEQLINLSKLHRFPEVLAGIRQIKSSPTWPGIPAAFRARVLRFEGTTLINLHGDVEAAKRLTEEGRQIHPEGDFQVADAYLAYRNGDRGLALRLLETPKSLNAFNLRLGLILEAGHPKAVVEATSAVPPPWEADPDTHRYAALGYILLRRIFDARHRVTLALKDGSKQPPVREASALVGYFGAISPAFTMAFGNLKWPSPVPWPFVKRDRQTTTDLARAADVFHTLSKEPTTAAADRIRYARWRIGCLACSLPLQADAAVAVRERLASDPCDTVAIIWALTRGYDFDRSAAEAALVAHIEKKGGVEEALALQSLRFARDDFAGLEQLLEKHRTMFIAAGQHALWDAQSELVREAKGEAVQQPSAAVEAIGQNEPDSGWALFESCEAKLRAEDWNFVADRADQLIQQVGTDTALRLAVNGLFRAGRHADCLETLEKNRPLLMDGVLTPDLLTLRIECRRKLGHLSAALKDAEEAFANDQSFPSLLHLFRIQLGAGDSYGAIESARTSLRIGGVSAGFYFEAAHLLAPLDKELAVALWRQAMSDKTFANQNPVFAHTVALRLGLDREAAPLLERLAALAREGKGGVVSLTLPQTRQQMAEISRASADTWQTYSRGLIPAHLVASHTGLTLGHLYHTIPRQNHAAAQPALSTPAFFRSANRSHTDSKPLTDAKGRLHLDITALLLAHELDLLDMVESQFGPLNISPELTTCLFKEIEQASRLQVTRHLAALELLRLEMEGVLGTLPAPAESSAPHELAATMGAEWCACLAQAHAGDGRIVDYLPLRSNTDDLHPAVLSALDQIRVWGVADCARAVHLAGHISAGEYERVVERIRGYGPAQSDDLIRSGLGRPVHLLGNVWEPLNDAGVLSHLCKALKVTIDPSELDDARRLRSQATDDQDLVASLQRLLQRINEGLLAGRYQVNPVPQLQPAKQPQTPAEKVLLDLIAVGSSAPGYAWTDDRHLSRYKFCGTMPLIGVWEVLQELRRSKVLSDQDYFDKLDWLRRANVRYVPIRAEEVCHQLWQAPPGVTLVETSALAALRRYVASCLLDRERLQPPQPGRNKVLRWHDYTFAIELQQELHQALGDIWRDPSRDEERQRAEADWLWNALYFDISGFRQLMAPSGADTEVAECTVLALSTLLVRAIVVPSPAKSEDTPRSRYLSWLHQHVVQPFLATNAPVRTALARAIGSHIRRALGRRIAGPKRKSRAVMAALLQRFVLELPEELVAEMGLSGDEWHRIGITMNGPTVTIGPYSFDAAAFWTAAAQAINGTVARIAPRDSQQAISLTRFVDEARPQSILLKLQDEASGQELTTSDSLHPILLASERDRLAFLEQNRCYLDTTAKERTKEMIRIARLESPAERMMALQTWQNSSLPIFYQQLDRRIRHAGAFDLASLALPDWRHALRHLRIDPGVEAPDLRSMATGLLADEGLSVAIQRMSCLPVPLDASLTQAFRTLPPDEAGPLLDELHRELRSPVQLVHLLNLTGLHVQTEPSAVARAQAILDRLLADQPGMRQFTSFLALLRIVRKALTATGSAVRENPARCLLINWYHASCLFNVLVGSKIDDDGLPEFLRSASQSWTADVFDRVPGYWEDVAHPQHVTRGNFLIHGLDSVLRGWPETVAAKIPVQESVAKAITEVETRTSVQLRLAFVADWALYQNQLGTFLSTGTMRAVVWNDNIEPVISGDMVATQAAARRYIEDIVSGEESKEGWARLNALFGDAPAPVELHPDLRRLLDKVDLMAFHRAHPDNSGFVLRSVVRFANKLGEPDLTARIEQQVLGVAKAAGPKISPEMALVLLDAILTLSIRVGDQHGTAKAFFERAQRLMGISPSIATSLKDQTSGWMSDLPLAQQGALWPFLVHIRALAD